MIFNTIQTYKNKYSVWSIIFILFSLVVWALFSGLSPKAMAKEFAIVDWVDLIPKQDLDVLLNPPKSLDAIADGSALDVLPTDPLASSVEQAINNSTQPPSAEETAYIAALKSTNVKAEYNKKNIRIAGFIVPVEYDNKQLITEFFLVPYFGACIHVPPPPPNQIIYVKYPKGLIIDVLYNPFWVDGQLLTETVENNLALSAYSLNAEAVKPYEQYQK
jgi:hypothetical protein